jgi:Ribonuclease G/E
MKGEQLDRIYKAVDAGRAFTRGLFRRLPRTAMVSCRSRNLKTYSRRVCRSPRPVSTDLIKEGQELLVQVEKEERGNKGAALTTPFRSPGGMCLMATTPRWRRFAPDRGR